MPGQRPDSWSIRCARLHTAPPLRGRGKGGQSPLNPTPNPAEIRWSAFSRFSGLSPYPSNIAKVLGATLPEALKRTENAAARQKLASMRRMLESKGG